MEETSGRASLREIGLSDFSTATTEIALIKVQNYILSALDAGPSAILLMLDLSAAFDTIDHDILLFRLCIMFTI